MALGLLFVLFLAFAFYGVRAFFLQKEYQMKVASRVIENKFKRFEEKQTFIEDFLKENESQIADVFFQKISELETQIQFLKKEMKKLEFKNQISSEVAPQSKGAHKTFVKAEKKKLENLKKESDERFDFGESPFI